MTGEKFDAIVKARAKERMNKKIEMLKVHVANALLKLDINVSGLTNSCCLCTHGRECLDILSSDNHHKGWPRWLFESEEEAVASELLSTLDEMSKALLAASTPHDYENEMEEAPQDGKETP